MDLERDVSCVSMKWIKSLLCDVIANKYVGRGHDTGIEELLIKLDYSN